jgi:hypothetical protein
VLYRSVALSLISLLAAVPEARALPAVFQSDSGDGTDSGVAVLPVTGTTTDLELWLEAEAEFLGFSVSLRAETGLALLSFSPEPLGDPDADVRFNLVAGDGGALSLVGGNGFLLLGPRVRLGALGVEARAAGGQLLVDAVPGSDLPSLVGADFELIEFDLPQLLARVPEPAPLLGLAAVWAGLALRRRAGA